MFPLTEFKRLLAGRKNDRTLEMTFTDTGIHTVYCKTALMFIFAFSSHNIPQEKFTSNVYMNTVDNQQFQDEPNNTGNYIFSNEFLFQILAILVLDMECKIS